MNSSIIKKIIFSSIFGGVTAASVATPFIMKYISNKNEIVYDNMVRFYVYGDGTADSSTSAEGNIDNGNYWCKHNQNFFDCKISEVDLKDETTIEEVKKLKTKKMTVSTQTLKQKNKIFEVQFDGTQTFNYDDKTATLWDGTLKQKNANVDIFEKNTKTGNAHVSLKPMFSWFKDQKKINSDHFIVWLEDMDGNVDLNDKEFKCKFLTTGTAKNGVSCHIYAFNTNDNIKKSEAETQNYKSGSFEPTKLNMLNSSSDSTTTVNASTKLKTGNFYIVSFKVDRKMRDFKIQNVTNPLPKYLHYFKEKAYAKRLSFRVWERVFYDDDISKHMFVDISPVTRRYWFENNSKIDITNSLIKKTS